MHHLQPAQYLTKCNQIFFPLQIEMGMFCFQSFPSVVGLEVSERQKALGWGYDMRMTDL